MSRRHREQETDSNYKPQQADSRADGSRMSRWTFSSSSILNKFLTISVEKTSALRYFAKKISQAIGPAITNAIIDDKIEVDEKWVKIPRTYLEMYLRLQIDEEKLGITTHGRGRRFLNRLINTVADSKVVSYVKKSYKAVKEKCLELYEDTTQFATCCLKALFSAFAPDDDPYGKLSHYYSLIEHELPGLKSRKTLNNYYRWFVDWRPRGKYEDPKNKKERFKHRLWEQLIEWIKDFLQELAPQYSFANV